MNVFRSYFKLLKSSLVTKVFRLVHGLYCRFLEYDLNPFISRVLAISNIANTRLMKDEIRREDKVITILLGNFSNRVPEHLNYITSENPKVNTQND